MAGVGQRVRLARQALAALWERERPALVSELVMAQSVSR